jgi:hypothetical protein
VLRPYRQAAQVIGSVRRSQPLQVPCRRDDASLVAQFQDQPRRNAGLDDRRKNRGPEDRAIADLSAPVGESVGILQMDIAEARPCGAQKEIRRRRPGRDMGLMRISGIDRKFPRLPIKSRAQHRTAHRFHILDVLHDKGHAHPLSPRQNRA